MSELIQVDLELFKFIHLGLNNSFFDLLMPIVREKYVWTPFYLFIVFFSFFNMSSKNAMFIVGGLILTVIVADVTSSQIIKKSVERPRPCAELSIQPEVNNLVKCGSGYSFPSSHASNHFAIAFFLILSGKLEYGWIKWALLAWAALICFAQIYVGVHFPLDIIGGMTVGYFSARLVTLVWRYIK